MSALYSSRHEGFSALPVSHGFSMPSSPYEPYTLQPHQYGQADLPFGSNPARPNDTYTSCRFLENIVDDCHQSRFLLRAFIYYQLEEDSMPSQTYRCPMKSCERVDFKTSLEMLRHLVRCEELRKGEFSCPTCNKVERFRTGTRKRCSWLRVSQMRRTGRAIRQYVRTKFGPKTTTSPTLCAHCHLMLSGGMLGGQSSAAYMSHPPEQQTTGMMFSVPDFGETMTQDCLAHSGELMGSEICEAESPPAELSEIARHSRLPAVSVQQTSLRSPSELSSPSTQLSSSSPVEVSPSSAQSSVHFMSYRRTPQGVPNTTYGYGESVQNACDSQHGNLDQVMHQYPPNQDTNMWNIPQTLPSHGPGHLDAFSATLPAAMPSFSVSRPVSRNERVQSLFLDTNGFSVPLQPVRWEDSPNTLVDPKLLETPVDKPMTECSPCGQPQMGSTLWRATDTKADVLSIPSGAGLSQNDAEVSGDSSPTEYGSSPSSSQRRPSTATLDSEIRCPHPDCEWKATGDKRENYKSYLRKHLKTHERREIPCSHCDKTFTRRDNLTTHLAKIHDTPSTKRRRDSTDNLELAKQGRRKSIALMA